MSSATLAERALAEGRPALGSSFRFHRPRGPLCGRGYCFQCEIDTPSGPVLACASDVEHRRRPDPLRPLGRIAEAWPPWFYERRLGGAFERLGLELVRRASAAGRLGAAVGRSPRQFEELEVETVVVGDAPDAPADALVVDEAHGSLAVGVYPDRVLAVLSEHTLAVVRFERLVLATGSYERLPPIPGNDLPGVIGLKALKRYGPALRPGTRLGAWTRSDLREPVEQLAERHRLQLVWAGTSPPRSLSGRGRVEHLHTHTLETIPCDLFVVGVGQPALELAQQASAVVELTSGELPILVAAETPTWLELRGEAARQTSGVPDVAPDDSAFACLCEDVRVGDLRACVADGFQHPELVKRRTGAMTGPCQGKLCAAAVLSVLREAGVETVMPTARPLARPVTLADLATHA